MTSNLGLNLNYATDFEDDGGTVVAMLNGFFNFNPGRKYRRPDEGKGVLTGLIFLDKNQDGVHQPDEPGLPGVPLQLRRTGLGLRTDSSGGFVIQDLSSGVYLVEVSLETLPLGYLLYDEEPTRVRVDPGAFTEIKIAVFRAGRIQGRVYEDLNGNGRPDPQEPFLDNVKLGLEPGGHETHISAFGQFSFDGLKAETYTLTIDKAYLPPGLNLPQIPSFTIDPKSAKLFHKIDVGLTR